MSDLQRRPQDGGYLETAGERLALLGSVPGGLELWMWPLQLFDHGRFELLDPATGQALELGLPEHTAEPAGFHLTFQHPRARLRLACHAHRTERALVILAELEAAVPLELRLHLRPTFVPMWPAGLGGRLSGRDDATGALLLSEELGRFAALVGAPEAEPVELPEERGLATHVTLRLPIHPARAKRGPLAILVAGAQLEPAPLSDAQRAGGHQAAAGRSRAEAVIEAARQAYLELRADVAGHLERSRAGWAQVLERSATLACSEPRLEAAFHASRVAIQRAWVNVDGVGGVGRGLVAGLGPSHGGERPGFAWLFNGDALVASRPLAALGDWPACRDILRFAASTQREDGKLSHELTLSMGLCDWLGDFPYAYSKAQQTPGFVNCLEHYVAWSGDLELARELLPAVGRALAWCASTEDAAGRMAVPRAGIAAVEAGPLANRIESEVYLEGIYVTALEAGARLAEGLGEPAQAEAWQAAADQRRQVFEQHWAPELDRYGFAHLSGGERCLDLTAYLALPLSRGVGLPERAAASARALAHPSLLADWGSRMFAEGTELYDPEHYNTGSVFPYLTTFSLLALYRHGPRATAWQALRHQARLDGFCGLGFTPEFLAGDRARALPRTVPHQVFSQTAVLQGLLFGALGLEPDRRGGLAALRPALLAMPDHLELAGLAGAWDLELDLRQEPGEHRFEVLLRGRDGALHPELELAPVLPPWSQVLETSMTTEGATRRWSQRLRLGPQLVLPTSELEPGAPTRTPRLVAEELDGDQLSWTLVGPTGTSAWVELRCDLALQVEGATPEGAGWRVAFEGPGPWVTVQLHVTRG